MNFPLDLPPGIFRQGTEYESKGRYFAANLVRFKDGTIKPIGGWRRKSDTAVTGTGRTCFTWRSNDGTPRVAIGTSHKLYVMNLAGTLTNITPYSDSGTLGTDPFSVTSGDATVTVTDASHGRAIGDTVVFSGATSVGGLTMNGSWLVTEVPTSGTYRFEHTSNAGSTASGGGASVAYGYEISPGLSDATSAIGYGGGAYGDGIYGAPRETATAMSAVRVWTFATWGQNLVACPGDDGEIYEWSLNTANRAVAITNAPTARAISVSEERILFAHGADGNPRADAWSDAEDNTEWTASATTLAGDFNLQTPGRSICATPVRGGLLSWTNVDAWLRTFLPGSTNVYSISKVGDGCGIISAGAFATADTVTAWMGIGKSFWVYNGFVQPLPCDVADYVFSDFNYIQSSKVTCMYYAEAGEFWWFYPSSAATENDRYVIWSPNLPIGSQWNIGELARLSGCDRGTLAYPLRVGADGYVYEHEVGTLDLSSVTPYLESGPLELGSGETTADILGYIPDEKTAGDVTVTIKTKNYPNATETSSGPFTAANPRDLRLTGRQAKIRYTGVTSTDWRVGVPRLIVQQGSPR